MPTELNVGIFRVLSAILWLGNLQFKDTDRETCDLLPQDKLVVKKVAALLGISEAHVIKVCTTRQITVKGTVTDIALKFQEVNDEGMEWGVRAWVSWCFMQMLDVLIFQAQENRHAMAKALYSRTFTWLVQQINSCTNPGSEQTQFIGVLDIFGFENFKVSINMSPSPCPSPLVPLPLSPSPCSSSSIVHSINLFFHSL